MSSGGRATSSGTAGSDGTPSKKGKGRRISGDTEQGKLARSTPLVPTAGVWMHGQDGDGEPQKCTGLEVI
jgi:hypothetical protein